jgi:antitoxin component YwqK of YwqJK toxin-antitoxin module
MQSTGRINRLAAVALLMTLAGLGLFWLSRPTAKPLRLEISTALMEVSRTNLVLVEGRLREPGQSKAFSGFMLEHYPDGVLRSRSTITDGRLHGLSQGWYTNGQLQVMEQFKEGVSHGVRTKWYLSGAKQSEANIVNGKLHGTFHKWHENGILSEKIEFNGGEPEGLSLSYFPSGCLKARVLTKAGKPVEQQFWKDGERSGHAEGDSARPEKPPESAVVASQTGG